MTFSESLNSTRMKSFLQEGIVVSNQSSSPRTTTAMYRHDRQNKTPNMKLLPGPSSSSTTPPQNNKLVLTRAPNNNQVVHQPSYKIANGIKEHVKGKLSLGAKLLRVGGMENVFKHIFSVTQGEVLLKASQCRISTTAGPIAGVLFISTDKLAFCSDRSIVKLSSPTGGKLLRFHYKVLIPLRKIERANQRENTNNKSKKYLQLNTTDDFEFWFMGFRNYNKMFHCLQQAISQ